MDVLTLGIWEVAGTPIEGSQGDKKRLLIEYDDKDVVTRVGAAPAAKKKVKKEEPVKEEDKPGERCYCQQVAGSA